MSKLNGMPSHGVVPRCHTEFREPHSEKKYAQCADITSEEGLEATTDLAPFYVGASHLKAEQRIDACESAQSVLEHLMAEGDANAHPIVISDSTKSDGKIAHASDGYAQGKQCTPLRYDDSACETDLATAPHAEYTVENPHPGSSVAKAEAERLRSALVVDISFRGTVTLNLHGPAFDAYLELRVKHKPKPVERCLIDGLYAVHYKVFDETSAKRAIVRSVIGNGDRYVMHFPDECRVTTVPTRAIFEIENMEEVCAVPPQGLICEVVGFAEAKVPPLTVEDVLVKWYKRTVYVKPVDLSGAIPKIGLIDAAGQLPDI